MYVPAVIDGIEPSLRVLLTLASPLGHMTIFLKGAKPIERLLRTVQIYTFI